MAKILITGVSSGFGKLTALTLLKNGHQVVGTMRTTTGRNKKSANELIKAGISLVEMDVTDDLSVEDGVKRAIVSIMGGLDVVINNAGVGVIGMQEHFTVDDFKKIFDVNVFGVQRVNRAVLPFLRGQRSGLLIHISSLLGRITLPFYGPYNASKWALEALVENYRCELSGFGIECCIVEPGGFATNFMHNLMRPSDHSRDENYGEFMKAPETLSHNFEKALSENMSQNPQNVADAISELIGLPVGERPFRTVVDNMGMGDQVIVMNDQEEQVTNGLYTSFGMQEMLQVKTNGDKTIH